MSIERWTRRRGLADQRWTRRRGLADQRWTRRRGLAGFILLASLLPGLLAGSAVSAAENCAGGLSEFQLLQPGDDDSGIGGTGIREPRSAGGNPGVHPPRRGDGGDEEESGIGGTGRAPSGPARATPPGDDDSGIGGTGIYGTVQRGDRLCISGIEVQLPEQLEIESATSQASSQSAAQTAAPTTPTTPTTPSSPMQSGSGDRLLATGQVVFAIVEPGDDGLIARKIVIDEAYAGRIDQLAPDGRTMVVSGHRVRLGRGAVLDPALGPDEGALREGRWIAFHGLPDAAQNQIVATRLEPGRVGEIRRALERTHLDSPQWRESMRGLAYVLVEGFVSPDPSGLSIAGLPVRLDASSPRSAREGLKAGARVRVGGRLGSDQSLHLAPPPTALHPPRGAPRQHVDPTRVLPTPPSPPGGPDRPPSDSPRPSEAPRIRDIKPPRPDHPPIRPPIPDRVKPTRPVDRPSSLDRR